LTTIRENMHRMLLRPNGEVPDGVMVEINALAGKKGEELVAIVESLYHHVSVRLAAGVILSCNGDPRIEATDPPMVHVSGTRVKLGLDPVRVEEIFNRYRSYGLLREVLVKECPQYEQTLASFKIGKYCVTNQEFQMFVDETNYKDLPSSWEFGDFEALKANHPVFTVSFESAVRYCHWLTEKTGRVFRLPTEAEWEYVAGGDQHFEFPWGGDYEEGRANTIEEKIQTTTPIGMYARGNSPFGVMDMAGNVEEYTHSRYCNNIGQNSALSCLCHEDNGCLVVRGGSFARYRDLTRNTCRHELYKQDISAVGFRVAEELGIH